MKGSTLNVFYHIKYILNPILLCPFKSSDYFFHFSLSSFQIIRNIYSLSLSLPPSPTPRLSLCLPTTTSLSLPLVFLRWGSHCVTQADCELLGLNDPPKELGLWAHTTASSRNISF